MNQFLAFKELRYKSGPTLLILNVDEIEAVFLGRTRRPLIRTKSARYHTIFGLSLEQLAAQVFVAASYMPGSLAEETPEPLDVESGSAFIWGSSDTKIPANP